MKVRITKCHNTNLWYYDKIGEVFEVELDFISGSEFYKTLKPVNDEGRKGCIAVCNAEEVKELSFPRMMRVWDEDYKDKDLAK